MHHRHLTPAPTNPPPSIAKKARKQFFFEKKNQKTFVYKNAAPLIRSPPEKGCLSTTLSAIAQNHPLVHETHHPNPLYRRKRDHLGARAALSRASRSCRIRAASARISASFGAKGIVRPALKSASLAAIIARNSASVGIGGSSNSSRSVRVPSIPLSRKPPRTLPQIRRMGGALAKPITDTPTLQKKQKSSSFEKKNQNTFTHKDRRTQSTITVPKRVATLQPFAKSHRTPPLMPHPPS
jgi:hypothetical protein